MAIGGTHGMPIGEPCPWNGQSGIPQQCHGMGMGRGLGGGTHAATIEEPNKNVENYVIVSIIAAGYSIITIYTFFVKWELF